MVGVAEVEVELDCAETVAAAKATMVKKRILDEFEINTCYVLYNRFSAKNVMKRPKKNL